jgi:hypothetical protein
VSATDGNNDPGLVRVVEWFEGQSDTVARFGSAIRQSFDEVFDGQRTGRYRLDQLSKVEKSYIGTKIEIVVQDEFGLERGRRMDYLIVGEEVDAKWSMHSGGWMIPTEAFGELCLCLTADDDRSVFSVGLIRADVDRLTASRNKDSKGRLAPGSLAAMSWLAREAKLPENLLLHLQDATRDAVLDSNLSGQRRIDELFRRVQERIIRREVVLTVAQQEDGPKRVRDARKHLAQFDIVILGHQGEHPEVARAFGLPVPRKGEWISVSVTDAAEGEPGAALIGGRWKRPVFPPEGRP